ncbi:MAG: hypothetical protein AAF404_11575 [Pseudomonadota bacterium]
MRYVLFISEDFVLVKAQGARGSNGGVLFKNTTTDRERFTQYLIERQAAVFCGVVDTADIEFQSETLPKLRRRDASRAVRSFVSRKCDEKGLWYRAFQDSSRNSTEGIQIRLSTLGSLCCCAHWLEILQANAVLISELCLLAELCAQIMSDNKLSAPVLVVPVSAHSCRIIGFDQNQPVISRKQVMAVSPFEDLIDQIDKTHQFVNRNSARKADSPVALYLGEVNDDQRHGLSEKGIEVRPPNEFLPGKKSLSVQSVDCVELLMRLMKKRAVRQRYQLTGHYQQAFSERRARHGYLAGILCCVAFGSAGAFAGSVITQNLQQLTTEVHLTNNNLDNRLAVFQTGVDTEAGQIDGLRYAVQVGRRMDQLAGNAPMKLLQPLAVQLAHFPTVHITTVDWWLDAVVDIERPDSPVEYQAKVTGYVDHTDFGIADTSRRFNEFVSRLAGDSQIDFVDVRESPTGFTGNSRPIRPGDLPDSMKFTISLGARHSVSN